QALSAADNSAATGSSTPVGSAALKAISITFMPRALNLVRVSMLMARTLFARPVCDGSPPCAARSAMLGDHHYLYATGGLALGGVKSSAALTDIPPEAPIIYAGSESATRAGWTVGAGYEYAFNDRLSLKLEYLHFDLGEVHYSVPRVDQFAACCAP